ncbi:type II secretion system protein GspD [Chitinimonas naiadis]
MFFILTRLSLVFVLLLVSPLTKAGDVVQRPQAGYAFNLNAVPLPQVLTLVYGEVLHEPYLLDDSIKGALVTLNLKGAEPEAVRQVLDAYLAGRGVRHTIKSGVHVFDAGSGAASGTPAKPGSGVSDAALPHESSPPKPDAQSAFLFRSHNRPVGDLAKVLGSILAGGSVQTIADDSVLLVGNPERVALARTIAEQYDQPVDELSVRASIVEYTATSDDGQGLAGALKVLGGRLSLQFGDSPLANALSLKTGSVDAVLSALSQDSRFSILDTSTLRIVSGKQGQLNVGQDVPVLGQITTDNTGKALQSVTYRPSGLILSIKPVKVGNTVHANVHQTLSSFAVTKTSNIDSPTLLKRDLETDLTAEFGELVIIGGLDEQQVTKASGGLLGWRFSNSNTSSKTTLLLLLQFNRV